MFYSIKSRLVASFIGVSFFVGAISLGVGGELLNESVFGEAKNRVSLDLNAADEIYRNRIKLVEVSLNITTLGYGFVLALKDRDRPDLILRLRKCLSMLPSTSPGFVTEKGENLCRMGPNSLVSAPSKNPIADLALIRKASVSGTFILDHEFLLSENPSLADRAKTTTARLKRESPSQKDVLGMALAAAVPVFHDGELLGVIYGGILLNQDRTIVDTVTGCCFPQREV